VIDPRMTERILGIHREIMEQAGDDADQWGRKYDVLADAAKEIDWLVAKVSAADSRISTLTAERDEARRMYCQAMADIVTPYRSPEDIATDRQWDCFRKEAR
jgi:hypothetical protein